VLLVSHDVEEALLVCQRVVVLAHGHIEAEFDVERRSGPRREVVTDPAFVELREQVLEALCLEPGSRSEPGSRVSAEARR
jgi:sulfonate transport system ATP-binding protein